MDRETQFWFNAHILELEERALAGDYDAVKSLACMAVLKGAEPPPGGGEPVPVPDNVIDFQQWRLAA